MKERPILFSAPMVRAILEGRKTQTRRVINLPYVEFCGGQSEENDPSEWGAEDENGHFWALADGPHVDRVFTCKYGAPGDRLWVRETWRSYPMAGNDGASAVIYRADREHEQLGPWRPSIFMRRADSRITLEITDVRVQRLHAISEMDAVAEGCEQGITGYQADYSAVLAAANSRALCGSVARFSLLWDSINAARAAWSSNPWVWAITFKRIEGITP